MNIIEVCNDNIVTVSIIKRNNKCEHCKLKR